MKHPLVKTDKCGWCGGVVYRDRQTGQGGAWYKYRDHVCPPEIEKRKIEEQKVAARAVSAAFNQCFARVLSGATNTKGGSET